MRTLVELVAPALAAASLVIAPALARASDASVGGKAPDFTLASIDGKAVSLHDSAGKTVVLEWFNPDCPFVRFAHGDKGPLASQPKRVESTGVVWLAINSSAPGLQGSGKERNIKAAKEYGMSYPILVDENGKVGKQYGARTTPHMYVIDKTGILRYSGAIDNAPLGKTEGGTPVNYVDQALKGVDSGKVEQAKTEAYGCSVKYGG
jgi:peroxiredoxin